LNEDKGKIFSFGNNAKGQVGVGTSSISRIYTPTSLSALNSGISKLACGYEHAVIMKYTTTCYGKSHDNAGICSGNGLCTSTDTCACANGYSGNECATFSCNGIVSTDLNVCSGYGNCTRSNECFCDDGHDGTNCEINLNLNSYNYTKVYAFGRNDEGQLGIGSTIDTNVPTKVTLNNYGISEIVGGYKQVFMKNHLSSFYSAGQNNV